MQWSCVIIYFKSVLIPSWLILFQLEAGVKPDTKYLAQFICPTEGAWQCTIILQSQVHCHEQHKINLSTFILPICIFFLVPIMWSVFIILNFHVCNKHFSVNGTSKQVYSAIIFKISNKIKKRKTLSLWFNLQCEYNVKLDPYFYFCQVTLNLLSLFNCIK